MPDSPSPSSPSIGAPDVNPAIRYKPISALQIFCTIPIASLVDAMHELCIQIGDQRIESRTGGALLIAIFDPGAKTCSQITMSIGKPDPLKFAASTFNVGEKFRRLFSRRRSGKNEICSGQSADEEHADIEMRTYAGCIVCVYPDGTEVFLSASGWPSEVDEVGMWYLAKHLGLPNDHGYGDLADRKTFDQARLVFDTYLDEMKPVSDDAPNCFKWPDCREPVTI